MPHVVEYVVPLPMAVEEYKIAQLYAVARASEQETTGEDGVEIQKNESYENPATGEKGQYTYKIYHLGNRLPKWLAALLPKDLKEVHEEAWNAYPTCKTVIRSPYLGENFEIKIESKHYPYNPQEGFRQNVHGLDEKALKKKVVTHLDIAFDPVDEKKIREDPKKYKSVKTGRGPLTAKGWEKTAQPCMVAYKLVTVTVNYAMVGGKVEKWIHGFEKDIFTGFHRQLFCWTDDWYGLTIEDIRRMEEETKQRNRAKLAALKAQKEGKVVKAVDLEKDPEVVAAAQRSLQQGESGS